MDFLAKNLGGNKFETVSDDDDESDSESNEDPEVTESQRKEDKKRKEKHQRMEGEREKVRKDIRDKYGLKQRDSPRSSDKTKRKHRSPFPSSSSSSVDDKHQLHRRNDSPSMRRTDSPSPHPKRHHPPAPPTHDAPMTSQSKLDVFTSKMSSCVVQ